MFLIANLKMSDVPTWLLEGSTAAVNFIHFDATIGRPVSHPTRPSVRICCSACPKTAGPNRAIAIISVGTRIRVGLLEHVLDRELHDTRIGRRKDPVEGVGGTDVGPRISSANAVGEIEGFRANLHRLPFAHPEGS